MDNFLYKIIIYPLIQIIEFIFVFSQKTFNEIGLSIIFISVAISFLCLPLYNVAEKWQKKERDIQKKLKDKVNKIKAAFSSDEQYMILSTYYRQNHYHPVYALRSSFGLLIQIPFFIAAYIFISRLENIKGAPFLFIPDLGCPDGLIMAGNFRLNVLPILMTVINCLAGAVYTKGLAANEKIQIYGTAAVFLILLYNSPSALVIYWTMNNVFSLAKNCYFKISYRYKGRVILLFFSLFCFLLIYYLLGIHPVKSKLRLVVAVFSGLAGIIPWIFISFRKYFPFLSVNSTPLSGKQLFGGFIISFLLIWIMTGLFLPSKLIASSPEEFSFIDSYSNPAYFIANTALQTFGFFIFWPLCLYFLFSDKVKYLFSVFASIFCFTTLFNTFLFPGNYGLISVNLVFDGNVEHGFTGILFNLTVILTTSIVCLLFYFRKNRVFFTAISLCVFALLASSCYTIFLIEKEFYTIREFFNSENQISPEEVNPLFYLSKKDLNTVVIMLDRATGSFFPYIFDENSELRNIYSGFTFFPNTVSFAPSTRLGAPPLFGGYEYTPLELNRRDAETMVEKHNQSLLLMPLLFSENGYSVTITDPPYPNYSYAGDFRIYAQIPGVNVYKTDGAYTNIWLKEHNISLPSTSDILKRNLFWYSLFKISPLVLREGIYHDDWCSPFSFKNMLIMLNAYSVLDYLPRLTDFKKSEPEENSSKTFLMLVNMTPHVESFLQAPEYRPTVNVTNFGTGPFRKEDVYHTNVAAIKRIADWIQFLKAENVYDNTRIIISSDHGVKKNFTSKMTVDFQLNIDNFNPLLMVKDFNAAGDLKADMTFMTNADVPSLAMAGLIINPENPFTGTPINSDYKNQPLYIAVSASSDIGNPADTTIKLNPKEDWYIQDNIFDPKNWKKVVNAK
jgi:YidC/Oxa1 family membrane protein insertase